MSSSSMLAVVWHSVSCPVHRSSSVCIWHSVSCVCASARVWQIASTFSFSNLLKVKLSLDGMTWCVTSLVVSAGGGGFERNSLKDA